MDMLGRLPLSAEKRVQVCLLWPLVTGLEGQCHQKHLLELGVWGLEEVLVLPVASFLPRNTGVLTVALMSSLP